MNIHKNIHEMKIKVLCARWLTERYHDAHHGVIINEFSANKSKVRADLAYVSDKEIIAVEIKSRQDNINRLEIQIPHLKMLYNRVEIVTTRNHFKKAKHICRELNVGLHIIENENIITILKGRRRNIDSIALKRRIFPLHIRQGKDFSPTEALYRNFLMQKYGSYKQTLPQDIGTIDSESQIIRNLNFHHSRRAEVRQRRDAYYKDLEALSISLQSTQSSSNSSDDTPSP